MHPVIKWFVDDVIYFLKIAFADAYASQRARPTITCAAAVHVHFIVKRCSDKFFEWQKIFPVNILSCPKIALPQTI